jgi:hypothetical protein
MGTNISTLGAGEQAVANLNDQAIVNGVQGCVQLAKIVGASAVGLVLPFNGNIQIRGMYETRLEVYV